MNLASPSLWGGLLVLLGALALYAASPNQKLLKQPAGKAVLWGGLAVLLIGTILLFTWAGPATAIYIMMTLAMFVWTVVPMAAAWARRPREKA